MNRMSRNKFFLLLAAAAFAMFFAIGSFPLFDGSETFFAELAREMSGSDNYFVSQNFSAYPLNLWPLGTWLAGASFHLFGITEASARFPSAVMGVFTVLLTAVAVTRLFNERAGLCAGFILSSTVMLFYMGKTAAPETAFLFFLTGSLLAFLQEKYWLMYLCCGFSFLTKGPPGLLLPAVIIFFYLLLLGDLRRLLKLHLFPGLILWLAVVLPWYIVLYETQGPVIGTSLLTVCRGWSEAVTLPWTSGSLLDYPLVLLLGLFPWTGLALKAVKDGICESRMEDMRRLIFFQVWWITVLVFSLLCPVRDAGSLMALFPALAILLGWDLDRMLSEEDGHFSGWAWRNSLMYLAAAAGWVWATGAVDEIAYVGVGLAALTLLFGIGIVVILAVYKDGSLGIGLQGLSGIVIMAIAFSFLLPLTQDQLSIKSLTGEFGKKIKESGRVVYAESSLHPGVLFYTEEEASEVDFNSGNSLQKLAKDSRLKYIFVRRQTYTKAADFLDVSKWSLLAENGTYCLFEVK